MTNANLILALRKLKIPSLGFFDHWKGFDRLLENNELSYVTDKVCVIDDYVEKKLITLGVTKENIYIVGHPELELRLTNKNIKPIDTKGPKKICILSQPDTVNRNFESILFLIVMFWVVRFVAAASHHQFGRFPQHGHRRCWDPACRGLAPRTSAGT